MLVDGTNLNVGHSEDTFGQGVASCTGVKHFDLRTQQSNTGRFFFLLDSIGVRIIDAELRLISRKTILI